MVRSTKKYITLRAALLLYTALVTCVSFSQNDSVTVASIKWEIKKIAPGVTWKSGHVSNHQLFSANQHINIIEISPGAVGIKLGVIHSDSLEPTSQLARSGNAVAAINGSFFKMRGADPDYRGDLKSVPKLEPAKLDRNRSIVYLREKNVVISENVSTGGLRKRHQQGIVAVRNGQMQILKGDSADLNWEHKIVAEDILTTGPVMLLNGISLPIPDDAFCRDRHPRTAVAKKVDGTVVLFVVDGRAAESAGMSIYELQKVFRWLNCTDAINLDGGGSTTMYVKDQPFNGVVNFPSDNKKFDHEGEREVANAIIVYSVNQ